MLVDPPHTVGIPPALIDEEVRTLVFPRESIFSIRILPDDFDLENIQIVVHNRRLDLVVDGGPDFSIDTWLED